MSRVDIGAVRAMRETLKRPTAGESEAALKLFAPPTVDPTQHRREAAKPEPSESPLIYRGNGVDVGADLPEPWSVPSGGEVEKAMRWLGKFMPADTLALLRDSFLVSVDAGLAYLAGVACEVELTEDGVARTALPEFGAVLKQADRLAALWAAWHEAKGGGVR